MTITLKTSLFPVLALSVDFLRTAKEADISGHAGLGKKLTELLCLNIEIDPAMKCTCVLYVLRNCYSSTTTK